MAFLLKLLATYRLFPKTWIVILKRGLYLLAVSFLRKPLEYPFEAVVELNRFGDLLDVQTFVIAMDHLNLFLSEFHGREAVDLVADGAPEPGVGAGSHYVGGDDSLLFAPSPNNRLREFLVALALRRGDSRGIPTIHKRDLGVNPELIHDLLVFLGDVLDFVARQ